MNAPEFCAKAAELMADRGKERDQESGERSMARCVDAFNAMTGHNLSVEDGWLFMVYLKHARMRGGKFKQDDYEDAVAYEALMAEAAVEFYSPLVPAHKFKVPVGFFDKPVTLGGFDARTPLMQDPCGPLSDCSKCPRPCK